MAISNTGAIFKAFNFDGSSSRNYGVYITGAAVYNAPVREVEMVSIPHKNGAFALNKGRFENIEVTYPAGIYADNEADFANAISNFRNFLCSKDGYCRLTDDYNPNEYRMAIYKSGLEVEPSLLKAGEFEITFECMPQRYLTSGETEITVSNNQTITNPTLFDAGPLIKAVGNGGITFNGHSIVLKSDTIGPVNLAVNAYANSSDYYTQLILPLNSGKVNNGDTITATNTVATVAYTFELVTPTDIVCTKGPSSPNFSQTLTLRPVSTNTEEFTLAIPSMPFTKGTDVQYVFEYNMTYKVNGVSSTDLLVISVDYVSASDAIVVGFWDLNIRSSITGDSAYFEKIASVSTQTSLGNPTYIDCEQGEAYKYVNGKYVSINPYVSFGSDLPTLAPGANTITKSSTITSLKIIPRWWRV